MNKSNWLSVGKSFISEKELERRREAENPQKKVKLEEPTKEKVRVRAMDLILQNEKAEKKEKKKDKKKKEKSDKLEKIQGTVAKKGIDWSKNFEFNQEIKRGLLKITLQSFGEYANYEYGLKQFDIPKFFRVKCNLILGLKSDVNTLEIINDLNAKLGQKRLNISYLSKEQEDGQRFYESPDLNHQGMKIKEKDGDILNKDIIYLDQEIEDERQSKLYRENLVKTQNKEFQEKLQKNQRDVDTWIKYIDYQNESFKITYKMSQQLLIERKIDIIQKALQANPLNPKLLLMYLQNLNKQNKSDDNYKIMVKTFESFEIVDLDLNIFRSYLDFLFSNFSSFNQSFMRTQVKQIAKSLYEHLVVQIIQFKRNQIIEKMLVLIQRQAFTEQQMGYEERGFAILSSIIEFNLFAPLYSNFSQKLEAFEDFWESKTSFRLGELEHSNWSMQDTEQSSFIGKFESEQKMEKLNQIMNQKFNNSEKISGFGSILQQEEICQNWRPANLALEKNKILFNQESFVFFEDISHFLLNIQDFNFNIQIVNMILQYLSLPQVTTELLMSCESKVLIEDLDFDKIQEQPLQELLPFFGYFEKVPLVKLEWIRRVFQQICMITKDTNQQKAQQMTHKIQINLNQSINSDNKLVVSNEIRGQIVHYLFSIESYLYIKHDYKKTNIKKILKNNESQLQLWMAFAQIEYLKHGLQEYENILKKIKTFFLKKSDQLQIFFYDQKIQNKQEQNIEQFLNQDNINLEIIQFIQYKSSFQKKNKQKFSKIPILFYFFIKKNQEINNFITLNKIHSIYTSSKYSQKSLKSEIYLTQCYYELIQNIDAKFNSDLMLEILTQAHTTFPLNAYFFKQLIYYTNQLVFLPKRALVLQQKLKLKQLTFSQKLIQLQMVFFIIQFNFLGDKKHEK